MVATVTRALARPMARRALARRLAGAAGGAAWTLADLSPVLWLEADSGAVTGGSRKFTAADKAYFSIADNASISIGNIDFAIGAWVYLDSTTGQKYIWTKDGWSLNLNASRSVAFGSGGYALSTTTLTAGRWHFVLAIHDASRSGLARLRIFIDGTESAVTTFGTYAAPADGGTTMRIGADSAAIACMGGNLSGILFTKKVPTADEIAWLYNDHHPRSYSELGEAGTDGEDLLTSLVSFWPCNETNPASGLLDAHGSNDLTFTNSELLSNTGFETAGADGSFGAELVTNGGFETNSGAKDDGVSDTFTGWTILNNGGAIEDTATLNSGTSAVKITDGTSPSGTYIYQNITVAPSTAYRWTFYTRGDGVDAGRYRVFNATGGTNILEPTTTGVAGTTYTQVTVDFTTPAGCTSARLMLLPPDGTGKVAYFDDNSCRVLLDVFGSWVEAIAGTSTINAESSDVHAGSRAMRADVDSSNSSVSAYQNVLTVGNQYTRTVQAKATGVASWHVGNQIADCSITLAAGAYAQYSATFTAASALFYIVRQSAASISSYFDTVSCKATGIPAANGPAVATASDSIGTNHGTLVGFSDAQQITAWSNDVPAVLAGTGAGSLTLDGVSNYVSLGSFAVPANRTVSFWFKTAAFTGQRPLSVGKGLIQLQNSTTVTYWADVLQPSVSFAVGGMSANTWQHLAITQSGTTAKCYLNGVLKDTETTVAADTVAYSGLIGAYNLASYFGGKLAGIVIHSGALSDAQVAQLAAGGEATGATPVSQWPFNDGPQLGGIADGDPVVAIVSRDADGKLVTQPTAAKRFTYVANAFNGHPAFQSDGVDDFMSVALDLSDATGLSVYAVLKSSDTGGDNVILELTTDAVTSGAGGFLVNPRVLNNVQNAWVSGDSLGSAGIFSPVDLTDGTAKLVELHSNLSDSHFMVIDGTAGTEETTAITGGLANSTLYIGMRAGTSLPFDGQFPLIVICPTLNSEADRLKARRLIARKYGITLAS